VAVGEDVAALVARLLVVGCWLLVLLVHFGLSPHLGVLVQSIRSRDFKSGLRYLLVKCEGPAFGRACLISYSSILPN
jgi:hypothetical protein